MKWEQEQVAKYPPRGQEHHSLTVDLLVTADGVLHGTAALGKSGGIEDDIVVIAPLLPIHLGEKLKDVGTEEGHPIVKTV